MKDKEYKKESVLKKTKSRAHDFHVRVSSYFDEEHSVIEREQFVYIYSVRIENQSGSPARLLKRKWKITDSEEESLIVTGEGVVGEQPIIRPHSFYKYTSGVVLETEIGTMEGEYVMLSEDGKEFTIPIAKFTLSVPRQLH